MNVRRWFWIAAALAVTAGCFWKPATPLLPAPVLLPGTRPEMNTPGYWIARHPCPDSLILTPDRIEEVINRPVREELKAVRDLAEYPASRSGNEFRADREAEVTTFLGGRHYAPDGKPVPPSRFEALRREMNLDKVPDRITVGFALASSPLDVRELPSVEGLFAKPDEHDFDELQNSSYDIGTPFATLHVSASGEWTFVVTPYNSGWTRTSALARCERGDLARFTNPDRFVINLRAKTDLFLDAAMTDFAGTVQMGARLPWTAREGNAVRTLIPTRDRNGACIPVTAWVAASDVHEGYLPYTPRNAIVQAFEMLNAPYGWSGMFGEQDCSRFLQQTFACFGMQIPRKSTLQGRTGKSLGEFGQGVDSALKETIIDRKAIGGITLLQMPGHVVLYLGRDGTHYYAIHATWSYRQREGGRETIRVINRVVVSDLDLGGNSRRGSLIFRTRNIRLLGE